MYEHSSCETFTNNLILNLQINGIRRMCLISAMHAIINCLYLILNIDLASQLKSKIKETGDVPPSRTRQAIRPCVRHYKPRQILCHMTE